MDGKKRIDRQYRAMLDREERRSRNQNAERVFRRRHRMVLRFLRNAGRFSGATRLWQFMTADIEILNYEVVRWMALLFLPTLYITVLAIPDLASNAYILASLLAVPALFLIEAIRYGIWRLRVSRFPTLLSHWNALGPSSYFEWSEMRLTIETDTPEPTRTQVLMLLCERANRYFYASNDEDRRLRWKPEAPGITGSINRRIVVKIVPHLRRFRRMLSGHRLSLQLELKGRPIHQTSRANDGSPDS